MSLELMPLKLLLCIFSGWVHRQQGEIIDYLVEENRVLKEQLKGKRLRLTNTQRRRLAAKAKILGTRMLSQVATIVTPDTRGVRKVERCLATALMAAPDSSRETCVFGDSSQAP